MNPTKLTWLHEALDLARQFELDIYARRLAEDRAIFRQSSSAEVIVAASDVLAVIHSRQAVMVAA